MHCPSCRLEQEEGARFCAHCGGALPAAADTDAASTTAWSPSSTSARADSEFDDELIPRRKTAPVAIIGGVALAVGLVAVMIILASKGGGDEKPARTSAGASSADRSEPRVAPDESETAEAWWTPPKGKRTSIEALSYAFPTLDERSLGAVFDKELQPLRGEPSLFEEHEPSVFHRDEMSHSMIKLSNKLQLRLGFNVLFLRLGTTHTSEYQYHLYRALQVRDVVAVDESMRMREPSDEAVFYLAEIHRGHAYDMLIEGDYQDRDLDAGVTLKKVGLSAGRLTATDRYRITHQGLGLEPVSGMESDAIFATTPAQIRASYRATGTPVPIKLVFRTIPGRKLKRHDLPTPQVVISETWILPDGHKRAATLTSGRYHIVTDSSPNGVQLQVTGRVRCDPPIPLVNELPHIESKCTVTGEAQLEVWNYTSLGFGPDEQASLSVSRFPD